MDIHNWCGVGGNFKSENWKWVIWMLINRLILPGWQRPFQSKWYTFLSVCQLLGCHLLPTPTQSGKVIHPQSSLKYRTKYPNIFFAKQKTLPLVVSLEKTLWIIGWMDFHISSIGLLTNLDMKVSKIIRHLERGESGSCSAVEKNILDMFESPLESPEELMLFNEQLKEDDTKYQQFVSRPVVNQYFNLQYQKFWVANMLQK